MTAIGEFMSEAARRQTHCSRCGSEMVDVEEDSPIRDVATGAIRRIVWRQCRRYPRNGFVYLIRGNHDSFQLNNPLIERGYR